jgi:P27 family predicted phage terminase small subunit
MRGRTPTPTNLRILRGNPGKRPLRMDEFRPAAEIPSCPRHLKGEARKEWLRVTKELLQYGMVSAVDRGALAMLCTLWGRYVDAEEMIEKAAEQAPGSKGLFVKSPNGYPIQSPWLAVSNKAIEQYKSMCAEFGLTPAARVRVIPTTTQAPLPGFEGDAPPATGWGKFANR